MLNQTKNRTSLLIGKSAAVCTSKSKKSNHHTFILSNPYHLPKHKTMIIHATRHKNMHPLPQNSWVTVLCICSRKTHGSQRYPRKTHGVTVSDSSEPPIRRTTTTDRSYPYFQGCEPVRALPLSNERGHFAILHRVTP